MQIYIASDHAGFEMKARLTEILCARGYDVKDMGASAYDGADDYPDFVLPLARAVAGDDGAFGIVVGKSGHGEAMAANRVRGARAILLCGNDERLRLSREHNNANILSIGADFINADNAAGAVQTWLSTPFSGGERHVRRIVKLDA